jgi:hypothetical protein
MTSGPPPKPKRRRRNVPANYGLAEPVTAPSACDGARALDIANPHPLVQALWTTLQTSCEARFYSEADWARVKLELWNANETMMRGPVSAAAWEVIQKGLSALLISPAEKRRCAIEVKPVDDDREATAVSVLAGYKAKLKPV